MKKTNCETCGTEFEYKVFEWMGREVVAPRYCQPCADAAQEARDTEERLRMARFRFLEICPPLYRSTDPKRIPAVFMEAIEGWEYGPKGIGIIGQHGIGKTRAAYLLLKRELESERTVAAVVSPMINELSVLQFSADDDARDTAIRMIRSFREADILLIDDLGKGKMTERAEMELYALLEHRTSHELPTIWTANAGSSYLLSSMSKDRGPAILRRLTEFSDIVK